MSSRVTDDIMYGRQALKKGEPWIVPEALDYLRSIVRPNWAVFEWGAGGSTVWFAKHCSVVTTIEHSQKWTADINGKLRKRDLVNAALKYIPIREGNKDYADAILAHPDHTFGMVFVDGEVGQRARCMDNSWAKIAPGGWLMLDDSHWWKGKRPLGWTRVDFMVTGLKWIGERDLFDMWTSFFRRETCASTV